MGILTLFFHNRFLNSSLISRFPISRCFLHGFGFPTIWKRNWKGSVMNEDETVWRIDRKRMFCGCLTNNRGELCSRVSEIWDEVCEVCEARSMEELKDEVSDVMFGLGRLLGYLRGKVYVSMWFDERHVAKIERRMEEYGCVRSKRHLVAGMCPCMGSEK